MRSLTTWAYLRCGPPYERPRNLPTLQQAACILLACAASAVSGCERAPATSHALHMFGRSGGGATEFNYPRAIVLDAEERLLIVDKAARLQLLMPDGTSIRSWRTPASSAGRPVGLGVTRDGRIFAADTHYARVLIYDLDGTLRGQFGEIGRGDGQLLMPTDAEEGPDGSIYVSEYGGNDRITRFDATYRFVSSFGRHLPDGTSLARPQSLLVTEDLVWTTDACNHRVCAFTLDGEFVRSFGSLGSGPGELRFPYGIDRLSDGTLIICEYGNNRVQRFTTAGVSLGTWGRAGRREGELAYPWAVAVDSSDHVFVVDSGNNRVQIFDGGAKSSWSRESETDSGIGDGDS